MRISHVIRRLEKIKEKHGEDIEVEMLSGDMNDQPHFVQLTAEDPAKVTRVVLMTAQEFTLFYLGDLAI